MKTFKFFGKCFFQIFFRIILILAKGETLGKFGSSQTLDVHFGLFEINWLDPLGSQC